VWKSWFLCVLPICTQAEVIHALGEQIGTRLAKAEELGAEGNVEESLKFMEEVEELKKKKAAAEVRISLTVAVTEIGNIYILMKSNASVGQFILGTTAIRHRYSML